jgi:hypothetical protein
MIFDREKTQNCTPDSLCGGVEMCLCLRYSKATVYSIFIHTKLMLRSKEDFFFFSLILSGEVLVREEM